MPHCIHHPILVRLTMAGCGRFSFVDAGAVQYVIDQWCGRVLQAFGGKPVLEGGPFTLDDAGGEPRLLGRGPSAGTIHLVSDIVPWKLKVDLGPGGQHAITELAVRGVEVEPSRVYTQRSCFALNVACPGGPAFKAQWLHRVAADCPDGVPTRLTCTLKYFMAYLDMGSSGSRGKEAVRVRSRILTVLKYYGVQPGHVRQSYRSRRKQDAIDKVATTLPPANKRTNSIPSQSWPCSFPFAGSSRPIVYRAAQSLTPTGTHPILHCCGGSCSGPCGTFRLGDLAWMVWIFSLRTASLTSRC